MTRSDQSPRADARRNREKLLTAAGDIVVERGTLFPLSDVADRAGLGVGTLYRHFRDRGDLFGSLIDLFIERQRALTHRAAAEPTGWQGVETYIDGYIALYLEYPWMMVMRAQYRHMRLPGDAEVAAGESIVSRARKEGALRPDAVIADVAFAATMVAGMTYLPDPMRSAVVPRLRSIVIDGLRAHPSHQSMRDSLLSTDELVAIARAETAPPAETER